MVEAGRLDSTVLQYSSLFRTKADTRLAVISDRKWITLSSNVGCGHLTDVLLICQFFIEKNDEVAHNTDWLIHLFTNMQREVHAFRLAAICP